MTGTHRPDPAGQSPVSAELIADLHAGVLTGADAARVRRSVDTEPRAAAVYRALGAVEADLTTAAEAYRAPHTPEPVPPAVRARLDQTLAQLTAATGPDPGPDAPLIPNGVAVTVVRPRRRRTSLLAAAAAVVGLAGAGIGVWAAQTPVDTPVTELIADEQPDPAPEHDDGPPAAASAGFQIDPAALLGDRIVGPLADPDRLAGCLAANDLPAGTAVLGAGPGTVDGRDGTVLLIPGPRPPMLTVLVVGPDCGPGEADLLARNTTGG